LFLLFLILLTLASAKYGEWLFGRWFNPLTCYALGWGSSLLACELRLIRYFWISDVAWLYIAVSYCAIFGGCTFGVLATRTRPVTRRTVDEAEWLKPWILLLTGLAAVALIVEFRQTLNAYGSLLEMYAHSNEIYARRMSGEFAGLSYLSYFVFPASALAGAYTAQKRRVTAVAVAPILDLVLMSAISMQRMGPIFAGLLFTISFAYSPRDGKFVVSRKVAVSGFAAAALVCGTFIAISSYRGLTEAFPKQGSLLTNASDYVTTLPSNYMYLSAPVPALSYYLLHPEQEQPMFGGFTFAPMYRLLKKAGFATQVAQYPPFYYVPVEMNQATYLAYIHSDFGAAGIFAVPFVVGVALGWLAMELKADFHLGKLMILAHLFLVVMWSFSGYIVMAPHWFVSLVVSTALGYHIESKAGHAGSQAFHESRRRPPLNFEEINHL
jgi:oligosaccharide repeat unit polymerase